MNATPHAENILALPADHPAYAGHFPGTPILPAVVIVAEVLAAVEAATATHAHDWELASAKFLEPVAPGTPLTLAHRMEPSGHATFEVRSPRGIVASGTLARRVP